MTIKSNYDAPLRSLEPLFKTVPKPPIQQFFDAVKEKDTLRLLRLGKEGAPLNGYVVPPLLVIAAEVDRPKELQELIAQGADVNVATLGGLTPLMAAVIRGRYDIVELLLKEGANVDVKDNVGRTPLMRAAFQGHFDIVDLLLRYGASYVAKDSNGQTVFDWRRIGARASRAALKFEMNREECDCYKPTCKMRHASDYELECQLWSVNDSYRETKEILSKAREEKSGTTTH